VAARSQRAPRPFERIAFCLHSVPRSDLWQKDCVAIRIDPKHHENTPWIVLPALMQFQECLAFTPKPLTEAIFPFFVHHLLDYPMGHDGALL
jgi:hypothetical protein